MGDTLKQIEQDIREGQLGMARQRLHGLINMLPTDLTLRRRLGDVYALLQYPERAGCYWYLEERKTPEMETACAAFVRSCGGHPFVMLRTLKFRGGPESLPVGYARSVLEELSSRAPDYRYPVAHPEVPVVPMTFRDWVLSVSIGLGCLTTGVLVIVAALIGFGVMFKAASNWLLN